MLLEIIRDIIIDTQPNSPTTDTITTSITKEIKNLAKKLFFEGKINELKDYIFDLPNEKNEELNNRFLENLQPILENTDQFIVKFKERIIHKVEEQQLPKNIASLLEILNYGHLKGFLSMFNLNKL